MPAVGLAAAAPLIGGLLDNIFATKRQNKQNAYNHPAQVRKRAEEAGVNPLLFMGPGVGQQNGVISPTIGNAISSAAQLYLSGTQEQQRIEMERTRLEMENQALQRALEGVGAPQSVPGIYGERPITVTDIGPNPNMPDPQWNTGIDYSMVPEEAQLPDTVAEGLDGYRTHAFELHDPLLGTTWYPQPMAGQQSEDLFGDGPASWPYQASHALNYYFMNIGNTVMGKPYWVNPQTGRWDIRPGSWRDRVPREGTAEQREYQERRAQEAERRRSQSGFGWLMNN